MSHVDICQKQKKNIFEHFSDVFLTICTLIHVSHTPISNLRAKSWILDKKSQIRIKYFISFGCFGKTCGHKLNIFVYGEDSLCKISVLKTKKIVIF